MTSARDTARPLRSRGGLLVLAVLGLLVVLAVVLSNLITAPYVLLKPGAAYDVLSDEGPGDGPMVVVDGHRTYPTDGALRMTTVALYGGPGHEVSWWEVGSSWLDGDDRIIPREQVYPEETSEEQVDEISHAQMTGSQAASTAVALKAAGVPVTERPVVAQVMEDAPAQGLLEAGDVVLRVGGQRTESVQAVQREVRRVEAGSTVEFVVQRRGRWHELTVPTTQRDGHTVVGVALASDVRSDVDVTVRAGEVGGPSAGMMFALGIYDKLTKGALTGGRDIAGTGTIADDGSVGAIDGIAQKMRGARDAGATWFLAPEDNCDQVVGHVPEGMQEVAVSDFTEARRAVEAIAAGRGEKLPTCDAQR